MSQARRYAMAISPIFLVTTFMFTGCKESTAPTPLSAPGPATSNLASERQTEIHLPPPNPFAPEPGTPPPQLEKAPLSPSVTPSPVASRADHCVQLTNGLALPQLLPTGTAMGMSVDYELRGTLPSSATQVFWVIEPSQGAQASIPVVLQDQGNLATFVVEMKPDQGPFRCQLVAQLSNGSLTPVSSPVDMRGP